MDKILQKAKIKHMLRIDEIKHATTKNLIYLNDKLSGIEEYKEIKQAVRQELLFRKNRGK